MLSTLNMNPFSVSQKNSEKKLTNISKKKKNTERAQHQSIEMYASSSLPLPPFVVVCGMFVYALSASDSDDTF